jgi:anthranilate 1,2-dioxygenase small subunit
MEIQELQDFYVYVLDNDRLEEWPSLFIENCHYEVIPKENEDAGLPAPVIYCDNARMLRDRVLSLRNANIYEKVTYRHFLSGLIWQETDTEITAQSNYVVINTSQAGVSSVYQAGIYRDRIVRTDAGLKFKSKRCIYDTLRVQTLLAIPI